VWAGVCVMCGEQPVRAAGALHPLCVVGGGHSGAEATPQVGGGGGGGPPPPNPPR